MSPRMAQGGFRWLIGGHVVLFGNPAEFKARRLTCHLLLAKHQSS